MDSSGQILATAQHCEYCFNLINEVLNSEVDLKSFPPIPDSIPRINAPIFVSWYIYQTQLRGCIGINYQEFNNTTGTFAFESIEKSLPKYAYISAFEDSRFDPISIHEVPHLKCAVSLLANFQTASHCYDWEVGTHGIRIMFEDGKNNAFSATYLPDVASKRGWSKEETLSHLIKKAGFKGTLKEVEKSISLERYQSSMFEIDYEYYSRKQQAYIISYYTFH